MEWNNLRETAINMALRLDNNDCSATAERLIQEAKVIEAYLLGEDDEAPQKESLAA